MASLLVRKFALPAALIVAGCSGHPVVVPDGDVVTDGSDALADVVVPVDVSIPAARQAGVRAQAPGACDLAANLRCLLPWPSDRHVVPDASRRTGLRVHVTDPIPGHGDSAASLERNDGFSRLSPIVAGFPVALDDAHPPAPGTDGPLMLVVAQPGAMLGQHVPMRFEVLYNHQPGNPQSLLIGYPAVPLAAATEYAAVVTDALHAADGTAIAASQEARAILGLAPPVTQAQGDAVAYHAPDRAALSVANVDLSHVARAWSFTTRSSEDAMSPLRTIREAAMAAVSAGSAGVAIDTVTVPTIPGAALIVEGRLTGLPMYIAADGQFSRDASGALVSVSSHDAPFRVLIPSGAGNYPIAMFGHGLGGNFHDDSFDEVFATNHAAKVSVQFTGFTDTDVVNSFGGLTHAIVGSEAATAGVVQALGDATGIQRALAGALGNALAGPTIGGMTNPAVGRHPDVARPVWAGGSLGGTLGLVYTSAEPSIVATLLNVPGAAWTHFIPASVVFASVRAIVRTSYTSELDLRLAIAITQSAWDQIDGGAWVDALASRTPLMLIQDSIGDPVLPNIGSEFVAASMHAVQLGAVLAPVVGVFPAASGTTTQTTFTQYRVPSSVTAPYQIHGFAAGGSIAGQAARQQIEDFLLSVQGGAGHITLPALCVNNTPANSCDFSAH